MSSNQSRLDRTESQQYRNSGRSNRNYTGGGGSKASGTGSGGGATAAAPSSVNSNSSSTNNPALTSNRSFKKHKNVQGGQQPRGGAASGVHVNSNSGTGTSDQPVRNTAVNPAAVKPSDVASPNDSRAPRAPPSNVSAANNDSKPPTTLVAPAKAPADASFSLQCGSISPGYMNGMQVPPRTTSGPPNLDEQKREQMRHDSHRTQPTVHPTPAQSIPKQLPPKKDVGRIDQFVTADVQPILKPKREAQVTASARISQPQKQPVHSIPGMPMQMPFHQQQVPVQFGGPNPQIQAQAMSSSLPMSMLVPLQNHALPHQMFVPGLQPHPMQSQGLLHQGQNLSYTSHLGPQLPPQLGNVGMNMPPQFPQQQAAKYGLARKAVKITHPDIHEELRLDGSPAARSHSNVPQSHPISSFPAAHTMNYYPTPGTYNAGPIFFPPTTSLPLNNSQPPTSQPARLYSQVTGKPATGSNVEKDLASLSADVKEKSSQELHVVKSPAPPKGRKKKKDLFKKIEINASSDLYKGPAEKKEVANPAEVSDTISSSVDQVPSHAPSHSEVSNENAVQSKVEPEDWEDAAEIPTPKLEASQSGNQVLGSGEDAIGVAKKYSRDFLLIFAEQCTALPEGVEFAPYIAEALMATNANFSHESYSNTATGRNIDWPKEGLHVVKSPAPPKGRKKKKDLFKKIEMNASSDLYKGPAEKKEVANPAEVSDTISSSVDQVPSHAPSHCEVSNENALQSKVEPEDWEDAQSLIDRFKLLQSQDPDFFYTFQLDDEGHLCNLFWRDGISKLYYECYGDVVTFDTTYRTNKYNLICAPFVGVNNHWKNVYFGCAFMGDETTKSFQWLFQTFLDAMGGKPPVTFFTDQDQAMAKAIRTTMPSTRHRLCEWHIEKNAAQRIPHLFGKPEFRDKYFNKLLWKCESEVEFHSLWKGMTEKWNTKDNSWLNKLFDLKEKWSLAFNRDVFSADIKSTQRSESTNRVFNDFSCRTLTPVEFVTRYEEGVKIMRIKEARHDFISRGKPKSVLDGIGILDHAGCVFTFSIFKKFQAEFLEATKLKILNMSNVGNRMEFVLQLGDERHPYKVQYCAVDETISCSCHMFETKGWLCSHALRILHFNVGLSQIPCSYILKRWTKAAKQGVAFQDYAQKNGSTFSSSITVRHSNLTRKAVAIMSLAASDEHTEAIANRYLDLARAEIIEYQNRIVDVDQCEETVRDTEDTGSVQEVVVFDPFNRRRKGAPNLRMKSAIEKNRKKSTAKITKKQVDENDMISTDSEGALEQYFNGNAWWI